MGSQAADRREADEALRASEARLRAIFNTAVDGIITIDDHGIVDSMNPAAERIFGYSADEVIGRNISMLMPSPYHEEHDGYLQNYLTTGVRKIIGIGREVMGQRKDGSTFPLYLAVSEMNQGGRRMFAGIIRDITDRRRYEEALRQRASELAELAAALKRSNQELDQFAYITSHDLKAPLRGIAHLSGWIEEDIGDKFTPEAHQQMDLLRGRVHRMEAMIDGILQYSRVGRIRSQPQTVDVDHLLAEIIDLIAPPPEFHIEVEPGMPTLPAERLGLQQVFMNLIGNAIKHHHRRDGRITISVKDAGEYCEFAVADDGPGIAPEFHEKIFVIFQTLAARDKVEGTGIGLSLVKKIIEDQGGTVRVESREGAGATFRFTWPKKPKGA